jgi:hypothetical protein
VTYYNPDDSGFDKTVYTEGFCDVMALALHKLTGLPYCVFRDVAGAPSHVAVKIDDTAYLDVYGIHSGETENIPDVDGLFGTGHMDPADKQMFVAKAVQQVLADPDLQEALAEAKRIRQEGRWR